VAAATGRLLQDAHGDLLSGDLLDNSLVCDHETVVFFNLSLLLFSMELQS
jgi:hypothetical protein